MANKLIQPIRKHFKKVSKAQSLAVVRALNKAAKAALAALSRSIRKDYNIKASDFNKIVKIVKAGNNRPFVQLIFRHETVGLFSFKATRFSKGVKATIRRGNRQLFEGAFIANLSKGKVAGKENVFKRKGKERFPIKLLFGPSSKQLASSDIGQQDLGDAFFLKLNEYYPKQLEYELSKI